VKNNSCQQTGKQSRYSCEDFYMTGPHQWWGLFGPEHGVEWLIETRASEIALGDTLYSPFVACGKCQVPIYPRVLSRYRTHAGL